MNKKCTIDNIWNCDLICHLISEHLSLKLIIIISGYSFRFVLFGFVRLCLHISCFFFLGECDLLDLGLLNTFFLFFPFFWSFFGSFLPKNLIVPISHVVRLATFLPDDAISVHFPSKKPFRRQKIQQK